MRKLNTTPRSVGYSTRSGATAATAKPFEGTGTVVAVDVGKSRVVLDHGEIEGFMAPMVMSYQVTPPTLFESINAGDRVHFTVDPAKRVIVDIAPLPD